MRSPTAMYGNGVDRILVPRCKVFADVSLAHSNRNKNGNHYLSKMADSFTVPELAHSLGSRSKIVVEFLTFSLVGQAVTPTDHTFTEVDNLVWALGAYVEKKGKESSTVYRLD